MHMDRQNIVKLHLISVGRDHESTKWINEKTGCILTLRIAF